MRRWVFNVAAGLSLVLFLGTLGLWWDNRLYRQHVGYRWSGGLVGMDSRSGQVRLRRVIFVDFRELRQRGWLAGRVGPLPSMHRWGFAFNYWAKRKPLCLRTGNVTVDALVVPYWFLALLFAILPVVWFRRWRHRIPPGHCHKCGYDLRASEERCPECGTSFPLTHSGVK